MYQKPWNREENLSPGNWNDRRKLQLGIGGCYEYGTGYTRIYA